jgi:NAD(P)-dependent dehydrogenase (short-subunit alcohol dehydrogenase family)
VDTTIVAPDRDQEPEEGRRQTMGLSPMNRISAPEEIAELVLFLMSDVAPGVNGHVLAADNGMSAQGHGLRSEVGNDDRALS